VAWTAREDRQWAKALPEALLNDGGVIDNFGIETVRWTHRWIIVSDGGAPLRFGGLFRPRNIPATALLSAGVAQHQSVELNKRWLTDRFRIEKNRRDLAAEGRGKSDKDPEEADAEKVGPRGTYFGIASAADGFTKARDGYSRNLAERFISRIRTDLNALTTDEQQILENHAYSLAEAARALLSRRPVQSAGGSSGGGSPPPLVVDSLVLLRRHGAVAARSRGGEAGEAGRKVAHLQPFALLVAHAASVSEGLVVGRFALRGWIAACLSVRL
jgi:hypothetical protein